MALRIELTGDRMRGPGYGQMRLSPFNAEDSVELLVESNQGKQPYLGANGEWSAQEIWHRVPVASFDGTAVTLDLTPSLVDPIATQPSRVVFKATVRSGAATDAGRVMVKNLLPSAASGQRPDSGNGVVDHQMAPLRVPEPEPEAAQEAEPIPLRPPPPPPPPLPRGKPFPWLPVAVVGLLLLAAVGVAGAWFAGLPPFGGAEEQIAEQPAPEPAPAPAPEPAPVPAAAPTAPSGPGPITNLAELNSYLQTGPDATGARHTGDALLQAGKPDLALLAYQFSARQGDPDSGLAIARMYDPDTWSQATSPMPQPDAETAAYWYEPAAQAGHAEAQRQLGKIMLEANPSGFQHDKGLEWLQKAADAGDEAAKALVQGN